MPFRARKISMVWVPIRLLPSIKGWFLIKPKASRVALSSSEGKVHFYQKSVVEFLAQS